MTFEYAWAVNYATLNPRGGSLLAVVGDDLVAVLTDATSGRAVAELKARSCCYSRCLPSR